MRSAWAKTLGVLLAAACDSSTPALHCGEGPPAIVVRSGYVEPWGPIADGERVFVRCGAQGLRHVGVQVDMMGIRPPVRIAVALLDDVSGALIASSPDRAYPLDPIAAGCESPEMLVVIEQETAQLTERPARVEVSITDGHGQRHQAVRRVTIDTTQMGCGL